MRPSFIYFFLNSFANALTVTSDLGSAIWTASAMNLRLQLLFRLGTILFGYAILVQILNLIIRREIHHEMVFANLLFAITFSYFIQFWSSLLKGIIFRLCISFPIPIIKLYLKITHFIFSHKSTSIIYKMVYYL